MFPQAGSKDQRHNAGVGASGRMMPCVVLACCVAVAASGEATAAQGAGTTRRWADIRTWMVQAESQVVFHNGVALSPDAADARIAHRIVAASPSELSFVAGHEERLIHNDWRHEPFNVEIWVQPGTFTTYKTFNRRVHVEKLPVGTAIPSPIATDILFFFFPVWPLTNYPPPRNRSMICAVNAALDSGAYRTTSHQQVIGGQLCKEVRSKDGNDRIWLADGKDLCLMRREWFDPKSQRIMGEIITRRVAEAAPGLWMPVEVEAATYAPSARAKQDPVPTHRVITRLTSWKFGADVPASAFRPRLLPGSIELLEIGKFRQLSAGGKEHLGEVAAFFRGAIGLPQQPPLAGRLMWGGAFVAAGVVLGLILSLSARRVAPGCR